MSEQLTDWFPADIDPVRQGEYEVIRKYICSDFPRKTKLLWDGCRWRHTCESSNGLFIGTCALMSIGDKWRGLTADPNPRTDDSQTDDHTGICEVTE